MLTTRSPLQRVFGQRRPLRHRARRSVGNAAELYRALRDQVDVFLNIVVHLVEQLMQGDEIRAFHVPVRLLGLGLEIDGIGEPRVAQVDHLPPRSFRKVVLRRVHASLLTGVDEPLLLRLDRAFVHGSRHAKKRRQGERADDGAGNDRE